MRKTIRIVCFLLLGSWSQISLSAAITDTVTVNGLEWAQVDLFKGLTWNEIDEVCHLGGCASGMLNGFDMAGWTWASIEEMNLLFNSYLEAAGVAGADFLGPGPDRFSDRNGTFIDDFRADGWRPVPLPFPVWSGWTSSEVSSDPSAAYLADATDLFVAPFPTVPTVLFPSFGTTGTRSKSFVDPRFSGGAWFFKSPPLAVPVPGTLVLLFLGLLPLLLRRQTIAILFFSRQWRIG